MAFITAVSSQRSLYSSRDLESAPIPAAVTYRNMASPFNYNATDMNQPPLIPSNQAINILPGGVTVTQNEADITAVPTSTSRAHHNSPFHDALVPHSPGNVPGCHIVQSAFSVPQYKSKPFQERADDGEIENQMGRQTTINDTSNTRQNGNLSVSDTNFIASGTPKGMDCNDTTSDERVTNMSGQVSSPHEDFEELGPDDLSGDDSTFDGED